jgi:starch synthase
MPLRICFLASEVAPLAKTGGLADVAGALTKYLHAAGHDVRLFMPLHRSIARSTLVRWPVEFLQEVPLSLGGHRLQFSVFAATLPDSQAPVYLIDCPALFDRETLYGNAPDEHLRYILLTHAALMCCQRMAFSPQIFHCNDWHTGLGPLLLRTVYSWDRLFQATRSVMTIHNIGYQGVFPASLAADSGLEGWQHWLDHGERSAGRVNMLREGIVHAHHITTVSPTYAREIQTPEYGWGMDGILRVRSTHLSGILNGVDYEEWDPRRDRYLPEHYGANQLGVKARLKQQLAERLKIRAQARTPLLGIVSRLTAQKGFDLLFEALPRLLQREDFALAVLGSGDARYERFFAGLAEQWPERIAFHRGYSEELSHWIEAACDIFLMPSQYEPCGLNQMYSLRYGTVPVVRRTGGLADSVQQFDPVTRQGTGIVFNDFDVGGITWGLQTALTLYPQRALWRRLVQNAMAQDFSWRRQVGEYVALYERLLPS